MFKDFYEKNIYKKFYNKTTPEEKKEVVKNTGDWFPEEHENKIKGMDNVVANYNHNGAEQHKVARIGYTIKNCEVCGKEFESYRNRAKYCKECAPEKHLEVSRERKRKAYEEKRAEEKRIRTNALKRARERGTTYEYELLKIEKGIDPLRAPNKKCKTDKERKEHLNELGKKYRKENKLVMTPVGEADLRMRECASKRASIRGTEYLDELKKIIDGVEPIRTKNTTIIETAEPVQPQPQPQTIESNPLDDELFYLEVLQKAVEIVRTVKGTDDVMKSVDAVYDTLKQLLTK